MNKEFIPYEQASELEQLGFNEPCFGYYYNRELSFGARTSYGEVVEAPLYQQAFRWFREKYDLRIWIESNRGVLFYEYVIATTNPSFIDEQFIDNEAFNTYEEAELACLDKLIEIVKTK